MEIINLLNSRNEKNVLSDELIKELKEIKYNLNSYYLELELLKKQIAFLHLKLIY